MCCGQQGKAIASATQCLTDNPCGGAGTVYVSGVDEVDPGTLGWAACTTAMRSSRSVFAPLAEHHRPEAQRGDVHLGGASCGSSRGLRRLERELGGSIRCLEPERGYEGCDEAAPPTNYQRQLQRAIDAPRCDGCVEVLRQDRARR